VRAVAALALALSAFAQPARVAAADSAATLKGTPFAGFTDEDTAMFMRTARTLVTSKADGAELRWANDASGAWGTMAVKRSFRRRGATCRDVRGDTTAKGRTEAFRVVLCRRPPGEWRLASSGPAPRGG
jgi:surface antigen